MVRNGLPWSETMVQSVNGIGGQLCSTFRTTINRLILWVWFFLQIFWYPIHISIFPRPFKFQCFINSWYLAVDFQLYAVAPLVVYLIYRFRIFAICTYLASILLCIGWTLNVHEHHQLTSLYVIIYFPCHPKIYFSIEVRKLCNRDSH